MLRFTHFTFCYCVVLELTFSLMRKKNKITRKKQEQELEKIRGRREGYDDMKQSMKAADTDSNFFFSR